MGSKKIKHYKKCPYCSQELEDYDSYPPIFSLRYLQKGFDLTRHDDAKIAFYNQMLKLSQIPWKEINRAHRHGLGYEKIARESLRTTVPDCVKQDATIIAFRFDGLAPMVGYRDKNIFHVIWFDVDFTLYAHG